MNINIDNYLGDDEIKDIITSEMRDLVKKHLSDENNITRIISNSAYQLVYKMVDETFDQSLSSMLTEKVGEDFTTSHSRQYPKDKRCCSGTNPSTYQNSIKRESERAHQRRN